MKKILINIGVVIIVAGLGYVFGRHVQPARVEIKEVEVVKKDVRTVVKTVKQPDGTVIRERVTEDKTVTSNETSTKTDNGKLWKVNVMSTLNGSEQALMIQKKYLGPISVGAYATSKQVYGVTVGVEF